jgi:PAS domain S-box-containing protein
MNTGNTQVHEARPRPGKVEVEALWSVIDQLPIAVYIKDESSRFTYVNSESARSLGISFPAQAIGLTDADFFSRESAAKWIESEKRIMSTGEPVTDDEEVEERLRGATTWALTSKFPMKTSTGDTIGIFGISKDITQYKAAKSKEQFYLTVLDALPVLVFVKDSNGRFVFINNAIAENFNLEKSQIVDKTDREINPNLEQVERFEEADRRVLASRHETVIQAERLTNLKTGKTRILTTRKMPLRFPDESSGLHVLGVASDITELQEAKEDLQTSLSVLTEAVADIESSRNEDEACQYALLHVQKLSYSSVMLSFLKPIDGKLYILGDERYATDVWKNTAGETSVEFDAPEDSWDMLPAVLRNRHPEFVSDSHENENRYIARCRRHGILSQYIVPLATESMRIGVMQVDLGSSKERPQVICRMYDALAAHLSLAIERHRTLARLDALNDQLLRQAKLIAYSSAATRIVHQLNHSIFLYLVKLDKAQGDPEIRTNKAALEFLKITRTFVAQWYASLSDSMKEIQGERTLCVYRVESVVKEMIGDLIHKASLKNCKIVGVYEDPTIEIWVNIYEFKEMLSCLIINAIDASAKKITITVRLLSGEELCLGQKQYVEIQVCDNGVGIPAEYHDLIGKFGWTSKGKKGHGIGLTIVDLLARNMGGALLLESGGRSSGERETVFSLRIPMRSESNGG